MFVFKIIKRLKKFLAEIILISLAFLITTITAFLYFQSVKNYEKQEKNESVAVAETMAKPSKIYVDVSGSVKNPGLYEALNGQRLESIIKKAGGLTDSADKDFFARNFNLASEVSDRQKIYIPTVWEVANGYFTEKGREMSYVDDQNDIPINADLIDINKATLEELDTIPGVGLVTAQKIINNRPYGALQELVDKKVFSKNALEKIKEMIGI